MRSPNLKASAGRIAMLRACLLLFFVGLAVRASYLCLFNDQAIERGDRQILSSVFLASERGKIFDRTEKPLAISIDTPSVYASRSEVKDPHKTAHLLAKILGESPASLESRLAKSHKGNFVFLERWITPKQADAIRALGLPGIGIKDEPKRAYPGKELAASILGFTNIDGQGVRGVEQQANRWLLGKPRRVGVERDEHGRIFFVEAVEPHTLAGNDLQLTVDTRYQGSAEAALEKAIKESGAVGGIVVTLDPRTGEILALAERPTFDPNAFREISYSATHSRAFLDAYEPGSTFKTFLIASALDAKVVTARDEFDCENGSYRVPGRTIRDAHPHGILDVAGILQNSSNIGATKIALKLGSERYYETLRRFGFAETTGSGFPNESNGLMRPWREWRPIDQANIAFGQGVSATAIQLAAATGAIANQGVWITPHLIKARRMPGQPWIAERSFDTRRTVSPETAAQVLEMMEGVVSSDGTARLAGLADVRVGGKTGTAQKFDIQEQRYSNTRYLAWFIGVVPVDDPKLIIVTLLDEPKGLRHGGGDVAAPLFAEVAAHQLRWRGVYTRVEPKPRKPSAPEQTPSPQFAQTSSKPLPDAEPPLERRRQAYAIASKVSSSTVLASALATRTRTAQDQSTLPPRSETPPDADAATSMPVLAQIGNRVLLPDLHGLSLAQVRQITENTSLTLSISGQGVVIAQSPAPGTILAGDQKNVFVQFGNPRSEL